MIANIHCKVIIVLTVLLHGSGMARAQFADGSVGMLQMSAAERLEIERV